jgi:hypothetical protein
MPVTIADLTPESRKALESWAKNPSEKLWNVLDLDSRRAHNWAFMETIGDLVHMARKHNLVIQEELIGDDYPHFPYLSADDIRYAVEDARNFLVTHPAKSYRNFRK